MAKFSGKLPQYCVIKPRKGYDAVYFQVPKRLRTPKWPATMTIGRTDKDSLSQIIKRGKELYVELQESRKNLDLRIDRLPPKGSLGDIIIQYQKGEHWEVLKPETKKGYLQNLKVIKEWSALSDHAHISKLKAPAIMAFLARWREKPRTRKMYKVMLSILFEQAIELGYIGTNLMNQIRLPKGKKNTGALIVWEQDDVRKFLEEADKSGNFNLGTAVLIGYETGQRMFDIMGLQEPRDFTKGQFNFRTSKTDKIIKIRATEVLIKRLSLRPKTQLLLTVNDYNGEKWNKDALSHKFREIADRAGLKGYQFRQLRNSAAIHAERAGLSDGEFEAIFGWPKAHVRKMLRQFYGDRDQVVADRAVTKLEDYRISSNLKTKPLIHNESTKQEQLDNTIERTE